MTVSFFLKRSKDKKKGIRDAHQIFIHAAVIVAAVPTDVNDALHCCRIVSTPYAISDIPGNSELCVLRLPNNLIQELAKRMRIAREIGTYKKEHDISDYYDIAYGRQQWGILHNGGNPDAAP